MIQLQQERVTDTELDFVSTGTLQIGDASSGALTITGNITRAAATPLNLASGAAISFNPGRIDTATGKLTLAPGTAGVSFATISNDVTAGNTAATSLAFAASTNFAVAISGLTIDTQYQSLGLIGTANLTGVNLALSGSFVPSGGDSFLIINNDGADPVAGQFTGLPEGSEITFNGRSLRVSYVGGNGNDVTLTTLPLQVTTFVPTSTGGVINFSRDVDQSVLNLYDISGNVFGAADIAFRGSAGNLIRGSTVVDPNLRRITFVATNGRLPADDYTLTLRSAANGFRDSNGELLDGDADGTAGGDFVRTFTVAPDAAGTVALQLPNFARGPLQPVNIPALATSGLPISFSDGGGLASASFELRYNPAILMISGATVAPGLPVGAAVTIDTTTAGVAMVQFTSPTPLAAGTTRFINLQATVPSGPNYGAKQVLDLRNIVLNGGAIPAADDDAVHVNVYFGDTTGNGTYSGQDASNVARLATGASNGLQEFKLVDALIIADITGNGGFAASDTSRIQQASVALAVEEIPRLPVPAASIVLGGPDPKLSIPQDLHSTAGGQLTIPVHIDSIVDHTGGGLESGELVIYYDATVFDLQRVSLGALLTAIPGWTFASRIDALAGRVFISFSGLTPLEGYFQGELVRLHAQVKPDAAPGPTAINLAATARDVAVTTQLNEGWLTLIPAPTDAANDPIDGLVTISARANTSDVTPTARLIDNRLLIRGTNQNDFIFVTPVGRDRVRVRVNERIAGVFTTPTDVLVNGQRGDDFLYVSAPLPTTFFSANVEGVGRDLFFAADQPATESRVTEIHAEASAATTAADQQDLALLLLLSDTTPAIETGFIARRAPYRPSLLRRS